MYIQNNIKNFRFNKMQYNLSISLADVEASTSICSRTCLQVCPKTKFQDAGRKLKLFNAGAG